MVNFIHGLRQNSAMKEMSILNLKAYYHGLKYVKEVFKLLPNSASDYLIEKVSAMIANLGAIYPTVKWLLRGIFCLRHCIIKMHI